MSLKYRNQEGIETPISGLNGTSGELVPSVSLYKSGTVTFSCEANAWNTVDVTFDTPMPDDDYQVILDSARTAYVHVQNVTYKTTTGFTMIVYNRDTLTSGQGIINWQAFKLMTDTVHEADSAHIAQNTANFAPAFSKVTSYAVGDYCTYNNVLYRCITAHTAGTWVAGHFTQVTVGGTLSDIVPSDASVSNKLATENLPTLSGTCSGNEDALCYATFDVTFDHWSGSTPTIIGIAADGASLNSKALIMVNNCVYDTSYPSRASILYTDGINSHFKIYSAKSSQYGNSIKIYIAFYTATTGEYVFKVQQRDYIGIISNLVVTNNSAGMPVSSWYQSVIGTSTPLLTSDLTSTVTSGSTAPVTSGGVHNSLLYQTMPSNLNDASTIDKRVQYTINFNSATLLPSNSPTFSQTPDYNSASVAMIVITDTISNIRIIQRCEVMYFTTDGNWTCEGFRRLKIDNTWFSWTREWNEMH